MPRRLRWRDIPGYDFMRHMLIVTFGLWIWAITTKIFAAVPGVPTGGPAGLPNPGDAITTYLNATPPGDASIALFVATLGDIFANPFTSVGTPTTLLGQMFLVFNSFVLAAGVIWMTYGLGTAAVQTAHEGQFMGKKLSQTMVPIRITLGTAGLIPSFGGFSLSQAILLFAMSIGIGGANLGYRAMIDATNGMQSVISPTMVSPAGNGASLVEASYALFRARVCFRAMQHYGLLQSSVVSQSPQDVFKPISATGQGILNSIGYGTDGAPAACGAVKIVTGSDFSRGSSSATGFRVASVNYQGIANTAITRARTNFPLLVTGVNKLADVWYDAWITFDTTQGSVRPGMPYAELQGLATGFFTAGPGAAATAQAQQGALTQSAMTEMKRFGWFGAGAWYSTIAEVNAGVMQAAQAVSFTVTQPTGGERYNNSHWRQVSMALENAQQEAISGGTNSGVAGAASPSSAMCNLVVFSIKIPGTDTNPTGNCSWGQNLAMMLIDYSTAGAGGATSARNGLRLVDPIIAMKNMGDYLMVGAMTLYTAISEAEEFSGGLGSRKAKDKLGDTVGEIAQNAIAATPAGRIAGLASTAAKALLAPLKGLVSLLPTIVGALFILGVIMSIWLPLVPFVNWIGGHHAVRDHHVHRSGGRPDLGVRPPGHERRRAVVDAPSTGYLFLINALFRPILMLLGFVGAIGPDDRSGLVPVLDLPRRDGQRAGQLDHGSVQRDRLPVRVLDPDAHHCQPRERLERSVARRGRWPGQVVQLVRQWGRDAESHNRAMFMTVGRFGQQAMSAGRGWPNLPGAMQSAGADRDKQIQDKRFGEKPLG